MQRLGILLGILGVACSSPSTATPVNPKGPSPAIYAKKVLIAWAFQKSTTGTEVFVETTDETGKQISYSLGTFAGECKRQMPAANMRALSGVACAAGTVGVELHAVVHDHEIAIMKLHMESGSGTPGDPMSRSEVQRIKVPVGAAIEVGS